MIEIDLMRGGERPPMRKPLPPIPYFVLLSRAQQRPIVDVWPVRLNEPLPTVPVPLLPGHDDVPLDLQHALKMVYDSFNYDLAVDYFRDPQGPFTSDEQTWVAERLRSWRIGGEH